MGYTTVSATMAFCVRKTIISVLAVSTVGAHGLNLQADAAAEGKTYVYDPNAETLTITTSGGNGSPEPETVQAIDLFPLLGRQSYTADKETEREAIWKAVDEGLDNSPQTKNQILDHTGTPQEIGYHCDSRELFMSYRSSGVDAFWSAKISCISR